VRRDGLRWKQGIETRGCTCQSFARLRGHLNRRVIKDPAHEGRQTRRIMIATRFASEFAQQRFYGGALTWIQLCEDGRDIVGVQAGEIGDHTA
jgi:hypothetical protein